MRFWKWLLLLVLLSSSLTLAQSDCPAIVSAALETADSVCGQTERNQLCYGNIVLDATPREGVSDFQFEDSGDIANVADVQSLQLSSFNLTSQEWGVALMRVQANLPDTLPGQNVTFLLFGNVSISDTSEKIVELPVTATSGVNVRLRPNTDASVLLSLRSGQEVVANGRLFDTSWIRVRLEDSSLGWVSADFLDGDLNRLLPAEPGAPNFGPMQAFSFTSGYGDAPCDEAPDSGILIQTPKGVGTITLRANDVQIELGSTVYLQAVPGDSMYVHVIEGHATMTAFGQSQVVPAGTVASVPLDTTGVASAAPEYPKTYNRRALQKLPIENGLPEIVTVPNATISTEIPVAINLALGLPLSGTWIWSSTVTRADCAPGAGPVGQKLTSNIILDFSDDHSTVDVSIVRGTYTYPRISENVYIGTDGYVGTFTLVFTSATTMTIEHIGNASNPDAECSFHNVGPAVYQP